MASQEYQAFNRFYYEISLQELDSCFDVNNLHSFSMEYLNGLGALGYAQVELFNKMNNLQGEETRPYLGIIILTEENSDNAIGLSLVDDLEISQTINVTPEGAFGIILSIFLILITYFGVSLVQGIKTPTKFATASLPYGKEYL